MGKIYCPLHLTYRTETHVKVVRATGSIENKPRIKEMCKIILKWQKITGHFIQDIHMLTDMTRHVYVNVSNTTKSIQKRIHIKKGRNGRAKWHSFINIMTLKSSRRWPSITTKQKCADSPHPQLLIKKNEVSTMKNDEDTAQLTYHNVNGRSYHVDGLISSAIDYQRLQSTCPHSLRDTWTRLTASILR